MTEFRVLLVWVVIILIAVWLHPFAAEWFAAQLVLEVGS